ncbi:MULTISPECIES: hypothetical protein [unclassified Frankia]|uniref:hypothetical protein n=1 Tax=unclassified Frankia TaxID=2632575 RepID=UPI0020259E54
MAYDVPPERPGLLRQCGRRAVLRHPEWEILDHARFVTHPGAGAALFDFAGRRNRRRRHSANGYPGPHGYENRYHGYVKIV